MIGERVRFHVGPVLLELQPSGVYQMLDLVFKGQAFFGGVSQGYATLGREAGRSSWEISQPSDWR